MNHYLGFIVSISMILVGIVVEVILDAMVAFPLIMFGSLLLVISTLIESGW